MKTTEEKARGSPWPFLGALFLFAASIDWVVYPFIIEPMVESFWWRFIITSVLANAEVVGWFSFWTWFIWKWLPETDPVKDTVELTKSVIDLLREYGLLGTIVYKIKETFRWATNPSRRSMRFIKAGGHSASFFLGAEPFFTGGRLIAVIFCASTRWKNGLYSLCIGNTIHVFITIKTWNLTFYLWDEYRSIFITTLVLAGVIYVLWLKWKPTKKP